MWKPKDLPIRGTWFLDGPFLPIEFARQSEDDRITLVLLSGVPFVRSLWCILSMIDIDTASKALARREGIKPKNIAASIGVWPRASGDDDEFEQIIGEWAERMALDAVVWTALRPKFRRKNRAPSPDEVISHLDTLPYEKRKNAEEYIRMTPRQIDTNHRRKIEALLHWTPLGDL